MKAYTLTAKLLLIALCFFVSCSPYVDIVKIDVLNPSTATFSFLDKKVAIVGNLYETGNGEYLYDSTLVAQATQGVKSALEQSPIFGGYDIPIYYTYTSDTSLVADIMPKADINNFANEIGVDMFIVVDYVNIVSNKPDNEQDAAFSMAYTALFRVYDVASEKPYASYAFQSVEPENVIMYNDEGAIIFALGSEAKASLANRLGESYAMLIAPYWETVERIYYISPNDEYGYLRMGDRYAQQGDWTKAMEYWNKTVTSSAKELQVAMAAYNMALGCEMLGDLTLAKSWLELCQKQQQPRVNPNAYLKTIITRLQDKQVLDKKLQVTND